MATSAAMIDAVDHGTRPPDGPLDRQGELENTLILFFSDKGACPCDRRSAGMNHPP
jgi:arylsulfatase A-like enzyme